MSRSLACGIDVGGTKIAGAVVDHDGRIVAEHQVTSPAQDVAAIEGAVADLVHALGVDHEIAAVGVGAAGYVDAGRSTVLFAPNLAWRDEPLKAELERMLDLPVVVENDANVAAWGEFAFGAGADAQHMLMVTVGTGVGGGIVAGGELYRGGFGVAAEVGHLRVVPEGHPCGCGRRGCLEQYASGTALVRLERERAAAGRAPGLVERAGGVEAIEGPLVTAAAHDGDDVARALLAEVGRWLGGALASLAAVLDPEVIVVGGGVAEAGDLLLDPVREAFGAALPGRGHRPEAEIRAAVFGNDAGVIGAADLARRG